VSDWEDVFGAGVSAESVINGLKSDEEYEEEERRRILGRKKREAEVQKRKALTAYRGDPSIKHSLISQLQNYECASVRRPMESLSGGSYAVIESYYNIPESLARLIDAIYIGLIERPWNKRGCAHALEWLADCLKAIEPGVDLRFVAPQFVANLADEAFEVLGAGDQDHVMPAFAVVLARARGFIVPDGLAVAASKAAWSAVSEGGLQVETGYYDNYGLCGAIVANAADPLPTISVEMVVDYGAKTTIRCCGDAIEEYTWQAFSCELLDLIKTAPTNRLKIVDLGKVASQLPLAKEGDTREKRSTSNLCASCHKPKEPSRPKSSKCRACDRALPVYFSDSEALFLRDAVRHFLKTENVHASPEILSVIGRLKIKVVPE
jgi:hypothetical protein